MQTYTTAEAGTFQIRPTSTKLLAEAIAQLKREGLKPSAEDMETSPVLYGEMARRLLASWVTADGAEPLKGLSAKAQRDLLSEDPFVAAFVLAKAGEQAAEWAKRFEVVSGN